MPTDLLKHASVCKNTQAHTHTSHTTITTLTLTFTYIYICLQIPNGCFSSFLYPLCTSVHSQIDIFYYLFFSQGLHLCVVCFCDIVFPNAWCHSERTRAAQRQVNSNWSKCTCGLSSSQSLGKYPINNPVTTTPFTPTHPHTRKPCTRVCVHIVTADAHPKHMRGRGCLYCAADTCG